jgi:AraC family transcriptional regulator
MATSALELDPPRFETGKPMLIAGLRGHFTSARAEIPEQWERLIVYGKIPGMVGSAHYGLCFNLCEIPGQRYAVFDHRGHVSGLYNTMDAIQRTWAPEHELIRPSDGAPDFFERYGERFDPGTGMGDIEVWIPSIK